eukprot:1159221-Pelagomonas_calceolata.AAC.3
MLSEGDGQCVHHGIHARGLASAAAYYMFRARRGEQKVTMLMASPTQPQFLASPIQPGAGVSGMHMSECWVFSGDVGTCQPATNNRGTCPQQSH